MNTTPRNDAADPNAADLAAEDTTTEQDIWNELDVAEQDKAAADAGVAPADADGAPVDQGFDDGWNLDGANDEGPDQQGAAPSAGAPAQQDDTDPDEAIWANATPEQRAAYDALEHKLKSVNGRAGAFQRRYEELKAIAEAPARQKKSPTAAISRLKDDYPEIAEPLLEALEPVEARLNEQDQQHEAAREAAIGELNQIVTEATRALEEVHPDWLETLGNNQEMFAAWVDDQPRRIREAAIRNATSIVDADQASELVQLFKQHLTGEPPEQAANHQTQQNRNPLNDRRQRQLGASASPGRNATNRPLVSGIPEEGDPEQIWNGFEALDRQKAAANREYR